MKLNKHKILLVYTSTRYRKGTKKGMMMTKIVVILVVIIMFIIYNNNDTDNKNI